MKSLMILFEKSSSLAALVLRKSKQFQIKVELVLQVLVDFELLVKSNIRASIDFGDMQSF